MSFGKVLHLKFQMIPNKVDKCNTIFFLDLKRLVTKIQTQYTYNIACTYEQFALGTHLSYEVCEVLDGISSESSAEQPSARVVCLCESVHMCATSVCPSPIWC